SFWISNMRAAKLGDRNIAFLSSFMSHFVRLGPASSTNPPPGSNDSIAFRCCRVVRGAAKGRKVIEASRARGPTPIGEPSGCVRRVQEPRSSSASHLHERVARQPELDGVQR